MAVKPFVVLDFCLAAVALAILQKILRSSFRREKGPRLPPGPRGLPSIGNVLDMPSEQEWLTFARWGVTYGDICSVTVLGQTIIILNSLKAAVGMLDKKSSIYSDRPVLQMGGEMVGWKNTLVLLPYGDRFRRYRRLFHGSIGSQGIMARYHPTLEMETKRFLERVLKDPVHVQDHIRKTAGSVVLRISHGYEVKESHDPFVQLADLETEQFSLATSPGQFLVDVVPAHWFPGAGFKRTAKEWASTLLEMVEGPHTFVKQQIAAGTAMPSFSSSRLEDKDLDDEEEFDLKWSAASLYSGAADTTVSSIYSFFLAMTLYPEVLKKAQAEIDLVTKNERLPGIEDRSRLPYIDALVKEVFRWNSVVPLAVPHRAMQDDIHEGFYIPKGSVILPNIWLLTHDPRVYSNPMEFNPDRYIPADAEGRTAEPDPRHLCFGFGRRTCPGMHLADVSVFTSCVMSLAVFDISKCVENGVVVEPVNERTTGTISHPKPFKCAITPRSDKVVELIRDEGFI
ncbi:cytochrome P450 [Marasmius fiardii PR-910]|nr:cytochrome P450 [Marasmius fiardii PR-910]